METTQFYSLWIDVYRKEQVGYAFIDSEQAENDLTTESGTQQIGQFQQDGADVSGAFGRFPAIRHHLKRKKKNSVKLIPMKFFLELTYFGGRNFAQVAALELLDGAHASVVA